ncbi:MAG: hypothetical protein JNK35_04300 [Phycisphaerae bacterium]|nr:hypothetical protein [Phycisphaerae bacterium]
MSNVSNNPAWLASGGRVSYVLAVMRNMAGDQLDIAGFVFKLPDATGNSRNFLLPMATLGTQVRTEFSTRILRFSTPGSIVAGRPDGARVPGSDPNCAQTTTDQEKCICLAQLGYDECIRAAKANNSICLAECAGVLAIALAACLLPAVIPGIGWVVSGGCLAAAVAVAAICVNACTLMYLVNGIANCREQFRIALVGCGIYW